MIPRTKVNYELEQLVRAARVGEDARRHRSALMDQLRSTLDTHHVLLAPSGRGALHAILKASNRRKAVVPAYTCKAVVEACLLAGMDIAYVEVEPDGFNMDVTQLEREIDSSCVVVATHQFGYPCDIRRIVEIARLHGARVVEDAAAAIGTRVDGQHVGTFGDVAFFSFDSTKMINVPMKAGAIIAQDSTWFGEIERVAGMLWEPMPRRHKASLLAQAVAMLGLEQPQLYGWFHKAMFDWRGRYTTDGPDLDLSRTAFYRYEMAEWQAVLAEQQLADLARILARRRHSYMRFFNGLRNCESFALPPADGVDVWGCIRFPIRVQGDKLTFYRKALRRGVDFAFSFSFVACPDTFVRAKRLANSVLDLPYYPKLTDREVDRVIDALIEVDREIVGERS